jgi:hypothetical protein
MAVTWTQIGSAETVTGGDFTQETKVYTGTGLASGYLVKIERSCLYQGQTLPSTLAFNYDVALCSGAVPAYFIFTQQATRSITQGDLTLTFRTYTGVPYDALNNPILSGVLYREDLELTYDGEPRPGATTKLIWS